MQNQTANESTSRAWTNQQRPTSGRVGSGGGNNHNQNHDQHYRQLSVGRTVTVVAGPQNQARKDYQNAWNVGGGVGVGDMASAPVKRKGARKKVFNDWQKDSGLAEDSESKIDISKAYQACLNKYNQLFPEQNASSQQSLPSSCDKIGASCSIYVTEISSPNLFLGIENNKQLKQSFQSLKKQLEQQMENSGKKSKPTKTVIQNSFFVCVNDPSEGLSRGFVVSIVNQICDVYLIDWGYINTFQTSDVWFLSHQAIGFCRPLARLFEIAGSPTDLPFPEGLSLPVLFHVKVMAQNTKNGATVVKVKYRGRDLIDYYYEPGLLKQVEDLALTQKTQGGSGGTVEWGGGGGGTGPGTITVGGGQGGQKGTSQPGDESSSATNSVVEEWLLNTADEQFSHFDESPPSPTDDEALANLMEEFELGDSVSAVVHAPNHSNPTHHSPAGGGNPNAPHHTTYAQNLNQSLNFASHPNMQGRPVQNRVPDRDFSPRDNPRNVTSISSRLNIKAGSTVKILISYVVLPTFFNFIPINQTTNKFREQLKTLLNNIVTNSSRQSLQADSTSGQLLVTPGQYFVSKIRGEVKRVTVKLGHASLERNKFVKIQDVDYGGEIVQRLQEVFQVPAESVEVLKSIPVLRCNGSMNALHPNSTTRRWSPEQCQSFRQLTESHILDATVARVSLSPQMSVPYYNFDLYFSTGSQLSIADIMRAFEYAS